MKTFAALVLVAAIAAPALAGRRFPDHDRKHPTATTTTTTPCPEATPIPVHDDHDYHGEGHHSHDEEPFPTDSWAPVTTEPPSSTTTPCDETTTSEAPMTTPCDGTATVTSESVPTDDPNYDGQDQDDAEEVLSGAERYLPAAAGSLAVVFGALALV